MALATDTGSISGASMNDAYGSKTAAFGTAITRVVSPRAGLRAAVSGFAYTAGTTAHTLTFLTAQSETTISTEAASGQAVIALTTIPTASDGSLLAANDFVIVQHEDGSWSDYVVSSISGLNVTLTGNLSKKVLKGSRVFFMGVIADHPDRQYTIAASTTLQISGGDVRLRCATANKDNEPILAHSANATVAGTLVWLGFTYGLA